jgi:tetratricopeptide (TPR) repeat protein
MAVHEEISDPHDDGFGRTALALGHFTLQAGEAGEAGEAERAIRAHLERIADRPSKLYANLLSTHARALRALDRPDEAAASLRAAIEVYESLGDMRFSYTQALTQLALTLQETGEGDTSIGMVEDAVARYASEDDRPDTQYREAYLVETLGILRGRAGDVEGAERDFRRSLEIRRTLYPDAGHPDMVRTLTRLGDAVRSRGRVDEAERILREAVDIDRRLHGAAGPAVNHEARIAHAEALIDLGRREEAETALVASSDTLAERPAGAHADARDRSLRALAALYDGWPGRTPAPRIADRVEQGRAAGPR